VLINMIHFAEIGDTWLFAVKAADAMLIMFALLVLGVGSVWLARRPQPVPQVGHWTDGRHLTREECMRRHPSGNSR
jgi:hypothetical protein